MKTNGWLTENRKNLFNECLDNFFSLYRQENQRFFSCSRREKKKQTEMLMTIKLWNKCLSKQKIKKQKNIWKNGLSIKWMKRSVQGFIWSSLTCKTHKIREEIGERERERKTTNTDKQTKTWIE